MSVQLGPWPLRGTLLVWLDRESGAIAVRRWPYDTLLLSWELFSKCRTREEIRREAATMYGYAMAKAIMLWEACEDGEAF